VGPNGYPEEPPTWLLISFETQLPILTRCVLPEKYERSNPHLAGGTARASLIRSNWCRTLSKALENYIQSIFKTYGVCFGCRKIDTAFFEYVLLDLFICVTHDMKIMKSYKFKSKRLKSSTASGPASFKTAKPPGNDLNGHSFTMCCIVCCSASHSQSGMSVKPHLCIREPHRPWLVRKRFKRTNSCQRSSKQEDLLFWSRIRSPLISIDVDQVSDIGNTQNRSTGNQSLR
jgi:hypothetical protein